MNRRVVFGIPALALFLGGCGGSSTRQMQTPIVDWSNGEWVGTATSDTGVKLYIRFRMRNQLEDQFTASQIQLIPTGSCFEPAPTLIGLRSTSPAPLSLTLDMWKDASRTGPRFHAQVVFYDGIFTASGPYSILEAAGACSGPPGRLELTFVPGPA